MFNLFSKKPLFFIIDDDHHLSHIVAKKLKDEFHCNVKSYDNLEKARKGLKSHTPTCILCDVKMPGENGFHLDQYLKEKPEAIPVIYITALSHPDEVANKVTIVSKPIQFESLFRVIRKHVPSLDKNIEETEVAS